MVVGLPRQAEIAAVVGVRPDPLLEVGEDGADRLLVADQHVGEEEAGQEPVPLRDVPAEAKATRLLAAQHGVGLHHLGRHELESDRDLVDLDPELLRQLVGHRGHVQGPHHGSPPAADLEEIEHQQRVDLELVDEAAALVDDADPVGIAVGGDAEVVATGSHGRQGRRQVGSDRFGVDPAEVRVALGVKLGDPRRTSVQHPRQVAVARPVHALVEDLEPCRTQRVQVDHPAHLGDVGGHRVVDLDPLVTLAALDVVGPQPRDPLLQLPDDLGGRRAPGLRLVLDPVEEIGVVAGGDGDRTRRLAIDDGPGGDLGRRGPVEDQRSQPVAGEDPSDLVRKRLGPKAAVVPDHRQRLGRLGLQVVGHALGHEPEVGEGEVIADDPPPAVRSELDRWLPHRTLG